jgi:hypothetical protein
MTIRDNNSLGVSGQKLIPRSGERGAALATAILMMVLLSAIAMTVLAVVQSETRVAGGDLKRTQTFYAAASGIEKMTSDFSALYGRTSRPTQAQLDAIALLYPPELVGEGFAFDNPPQTILPDNVALTDMRTTQGIVAPALPRVTMPANSPFGGLIASVNPFILTSTATAPDGTQVALTRNMNNYLIPLFQFGMFSDEDIELHPGATFTFNGRVHANGNVYVAGLVKFLDKVTTAHEILFDTMRNGAPRGSTSTVSMAVGAAAINVPLTKGSLDGGPNITGQTTGQPNYFPLSPNGTVWNPATFIWQTTSKQAADGTANKFGGQLLTRVTGAAPLKLPMELDGNPTREIIKRRLATDSQPPPVDTSPLTDSRYHSKAEIRILIDDEGVANDAAGLYGAQNADVANDPHDGVSLSTFDPMMLPNATVATGGGRALWRILDNNTTVGNSYADAFYPMQQQNGTAAIQADTVRGVKAGPPRRTVTGATNSSSSDIRITTSTPHGFVTGDKVFISDVLGQTRANGGWTITWVNATQFTLDGRKGSSSGSFNYTSGGSVYSFTAIPKSTEGTAISPGAGLTGHILIQIVDQNGVWRDVTREILSMGVTVGEPNAIVQLQRPLWAAFTQGSRDGSTTSTTPNPAIVLNGDLAYANSLTDIVNRTHLAADGQINSATVQLEDPEGYLTNVRDDTITGSSLRSDLFPALNIAAFSSSMWNSIVPINVYNIREGRLTTSNAAPNLTSDANQVYERGITNVVEINMKNLARWMDGVFDTNLLAATGAVSTNIARPDGYVVYVSDRRGDNVKNLVVPVAGSNPVAFQNINSTNGMADNVDIYGPNGLMDGGEDVQNTGVAVGTALVKDTAELPDPAVLAGTSNATDFTSRSNRAMTVAAWTNPSNYFRRSVRLFNAENLQTTGAPRATLTTTLGITISSENMVYTWGNYNTTGINQAPAAGFANLNDPAVAARYNGNQVPASIVADAWIPLSKTWSDSLSAVYPDTLASRRADRVPSGTIAVIDETSVRAGIIAGNNLGALTFLGAPDAGNIGPPNESRLNGGMHNFPRFMEFWSTRFNFVGALIPLYRSTQALGPYNANSTIYNAPVRNWAFDVTFTNPARLPPGTPQFQHIEPTGFRQIL